MTAGSDKRYLSDKMSGICMKRAYTISRLISDMSKNVVLRNMRPYCSHLTLRMAAEYPSDTLVSSGHSLAFSKTAHTVVIRLIEQTHEPCPLLSRSGIPTVYIITFISRQKENDFPRLQNVQTGSGAHSASFLVSRPWPPPKEELITKHLQAFLSFVKLIDFQKLN
jgi:hypothetical protein